MSAVTSDNPSVTQWGQSYNYDGFGNLTDQNVTKGSAPTMHVTYSASTNRQSGDSADANGNILYNGSSSTIYDIENRMVQPGGTTADYAYDAGNKRVWRGDTSPSPATDEVAFWAGNQKLATYQVYTYNVGGYMQLSYNLKTTRVYFGGKLVSQGTYNTGYGLTFAAVGQDRLGSIGKFYPYGTERPSATANDKEKFTGYFRDASTGLDYADQRYEQPGMGRFMTPDSAGKPRLGDPSSWNRYAYVGGDPINNVDPQGTDYFSINVDGLDYGINIGVSYGDYYASIGWAYAYAILNYYNNLSYQYNTEVSQLQLLQDDGLISGYTVDYWSGTIDVSSINWDGVFDLLGEAPTGPRILTTYEAVLAALRANPVLAVLGLFLMQTGDGHPGVYKSPADIERDCKKVGEPVKVPAKNYPDGISWEQEYDCGAAGPWTIHRLYDKNGVLRDEHSRPGKPKYGQL